MKATFGITEAEKSATRNVKSRNVNDVVDFCSFLKVFGCGRLVDVLFDAGLLARCQTPIARRSKDGGKSHATEDHKK